ncbi:MAG: metalloprotease family protein, partial [Oscillospiraceae bacterium]|nr:metalloprotease family protein [Oscillospiraceae bacterium]
SIKFGIKSLTPYFHCSEAVKVSVVRRSCLAPLWVLTLPLAVLSLITGNFVLYLLTIVMLFGSGADLWVALKLSKFNGKTCYALDMENEVGITVFVPDGNAVTADSNPGTPGTNAVTADSNPGTPDGNAVTADSNPGATDANADTADSNPGTPDANAVTADENPGAPDANADTADENPGAPDANAGTADARSSEADK